MAITVYTTTPLLLLFAIKKAIKDKHVETWSCDSEGDFTHNRPQFVNKAWFRPYFTKSKLIFGIFPPEDTNMPVYLYGIYHGRFMEMLLNHFDKKFTNITASALADSHYDSVES